MLPDEKILVDQAREGDRAAFEQLYKINREKIFRLAYGFVKNSADAEDLLQDIFTRAFLAIKRFKPDIIAGMLIKEYKNLTKQ